MKRSPSRGRAQVVLLTLAFLVVPLVVQGQGSRAFTPEDALNVRTPRIQDVSEDAR